MARVIKSFEPIIDENSRVLILGTMPGPESLRKKQYYANPRNQFWKIIYRILDEREEPPSDYEERIEFLKMNGIALWDVLKSCEREGASDSKIRNGKPNNFKSLLREYPNLQRIFFNGRDARELFKKVNVLNPNLIDSTPLPSTSRANMNAVAEKIEAWRKIKDFL
jgi:TDG/mug DNA glycosylase family protein